MHEQGQKEFQEQTGIDIEHDIDYVVAALATGSRSRPRPAWSWPAAASTTPSSRASPAQHGGTVEDYKGKRLVVAPTGRPRRTTTAESQPTTSSWRSSSPASSRSATSRPSRRAIDAQLTAHSITSNNEMMELVTDIGRNNNAWAVGRFDVIASQAKLPDRDRAASCPR